ncbi:DUF1254 domain-containing protein [Flavobacterium sp. 3-218]
MKNLILITALFLSIVSCDKKTEQSSDPVSEKKDGKTQDILALAASKNDPVVEIPSTPQVQDFGDYYSSQTAGVLAYQWGYALVRMEETMRDYINVPNPKPATSYRAPLNQIGWARELPTAKDADMPTANNDTFYMSAVLNLTEPFILETPDTNDRYYVVDVFDMYQNLISYIGRRTTGTKAGKFAIVPPGWKGTLPSGISKVIQSTTSKVWLWGRVRVFEDDDLNKLHALQDQFHLKSLSEFSGKSKSTPAALPSMPSFEKNDSLRFYKKLAFVMTQNPIFEQDKALVGQFEKIGLTPGKFDPSKLNKSQLKGLNEAALIGPITTIASVQSSAKILNGWMWVTKLDDFGYDYALRSMVAGPYLGGQGEKEAMYPLRYTDSDGNVLDGKNSYSIKFEKDPPVNAFWSLTMYDANNKLLVQNDLNRYKLGGDSKGLKRNNDGSFEIIIQNAKPKNTDNWLPAPKGAFYVMLRMYQPKEEALNGTYKLPQLTKK